MMLNRKRTLFVLAAQGKPPDEPSLLGSGRSPVISPKFGRFAEEPDGTAIFMCRDNRCFRRSENVRQLISERIVGHVSKTLTHIDSIAIVIHKTDQEFVYAMLGLADELRRRHWFNVRIIVGIDTRNGLSARGAVLECVDSIRQRISGHLLPSLVRDFNPARILDYNDVFTPVSTDN